jgi:AsmA protein
MNKLLKWVIAGIGIVVVVLVITAIVLPRMVDPNNYKQAIRTAVLKETGRELTIGGEINWTVFPWIGLDLSDLELSNRSGFGDRPMLKVGEAGLSVKLMPLFKRKVEIGKVSLTDVSAYLRRNADGQTNWEDLSENQAKTQSTSSSEDRGLDSFLVSGIEISNANVTWNDAGQITELTGFNLKATDIEPGRPFDLAGGFAVNLQPSQLVADIQFGGKVQSAANGSGYGIQGLFISLDGTQGPEGKAFALDMDVSANADIDFGSDRAALSDFVLTFNGLALNGRLEVTSLSGEPGFAGRLSLAELNPRKLMQSLGLEAPLTGDEGALSSLQAEMNFTGTANSANLLDLSGKLDQSSFKGFFKVSDFSHPRLAFDFELDGLNLDDYLTAGETEEADLTVEMFRGFSGGGDVRIGSLVFAGLTATDARMTISSDGKGIRLYPISAALYGGQHKGEVVIDASGSRPLLTTSQEFAGIRAEGLLRDLAGSGRLEGIGNFRLKVRTDLSNSRSTRESLSGDMGLSLRDGAIVGINVMETIRTAKSLLGKQQASAAKTGEDEKTEFSELTMTGVIEQGIFKSDDLMMRSPLLKMTGKGSVNLVDETIKYLITPELTGALEGIAGAGLDELAGVPIPVKLSGSLFEPDLSVDIVAALAGSQKARINEKKDKLIGKLLGGKDEADTGSPEDAAEQKDDPAKSLLKGFFGSKKDQAKKKDVADDGSG